MFPQRLPGKARKLTWGGALPTILDAIVDAIPEGGGNEPLIVEGTALVDEGDTSPANVQFTPSPSMPSKAQALAAFSAGTPVILKMKWWSADTEYITTAQVISEDPYSQLVAFGVDDARRIVGVMW